MCNVTECTVEVPLPADGGLRAARCVHQLGVDAHAARAAPLLLPPHAPDEEVANA